MRPSSQDLKVLVLDDYEGFAGSVPSYEKVKARAQVVILRAKLKDDAWNAGNWAESVSTFSTKSRCPSSIPSAASTTRSCFLTGATRP
jgi:hypothetical protein